MNQFSNLLNGKISLLGDAFEVISPINQEKIGVGYSVAYEELNQIFKNHFHHVHNNASLEGLEKLATYINDNKNKFIKQIILETGYTKKDSTDIVEGSVELVTFFTTYLHDTSTPLPESKFSYVHEMGRKLHLASVPYGVVSIMTPQNAPLILELTVLLNALAAGNAVVIRPSSQCVGTISLLIDALVNAFPYSILERISILSCKAVDFLELSYKNSNLIHYIGSSRHGTKILRDSLENNVKALVDGEGSSTVIVDKSASLHDAIDACYTGIIRSNGELCSSIRLIAVEETLYEEFKRKLADRLKNIKIGDPRIEETDMGPLFHEKQAENLREVAKKYTLISQNTSEGLVRNFVTPLLIELKTDETTFLQEEVYGPITGIVAYKNDEWKKWLIEAPYHLNNAVFSTDKDFMDNFIAVSNAPRIVINHDPSIESTFEPWGAFLPSGQNDVSFWYNKYVKTIQIDSPEDF